MRWEGWKVNLLLQCLKARYHDASIRFLIDLILPSPYPGSPIRGLSVKLTRIVLLLIWNDFSMKATTTMNMRIKKTSKHSHNSDAFVEEFLISRFGSCFSKLFDLNNIQEMLSSIKSLTIDTFRDPWNVFFRWKVGILIFSGGDWRDLVTLF